MIRILCVTALVISATALIQQPAQAREAPWCAVINFGRGTAYWDCQYHSLEACVPNVLAGNRGFCNPNPAYRGAEQPKRKQKRSRRYSYAH
jgi:hypothetical protein